MVDMVQLVNTETTVLTVTDTAVEKIKGLLAEKNLVDYGLRVWVAGGGCSGMQYAMGFENNPQPADAIVEVNGVKLIVDPISMPYIKGASIDFVDSLMGGGFRIENPNAVSSCGCGSSFRAAGSADEGHDHAHAGGSCGCGH